MSKPCGYYTQEKCYEEASKYNTKKDFRAAVPGAYYAAQRHGWLKDYTWFTKPKQNIKYSFDFFVETIKKYNTVRDFRLNEPLLYSKAKRLKWTKTEIFKTLTPEKKPYGYWTRERCCEESKHFEFLHDFKTKSKSAYTISLRNGWLKDFTWLKQKGKQNHNTKWTKEKCYEKAKKCNTVKEFRTQYLSAYDAAYRNGWLKDYTWFNRKKVAPNKKWTKEKTEEEARKYKTLGDFQKYCVSGYAAALKFGWINDYDWFGPRRHANGYWNIKENCAEEAKKYKTRTEFKQNSNSAYKSACEHNWIDEITSHMDIKYMPECVKSNVEQMEEYVSYVIYTYEDSENKTAYVGLTNCISRRHYEHQQPDDCTGNYDTVMRYFQSINRQLPEPIIIFDNLSAAEASIKEKETYYNMKDAGWNMLNSESALGVIGSTKRKWTYRKCFKEALKYDSKVDFKINSPKAYNAAIKHGWIDDYIWLKRPKHWNKIWDKTSCYNAAKECKTASEFLEKYPGAYSAAHNNNWHIQYDWFINSALIWDEERCYEEAKKYTKYSDFRENSPYAYQSARKNNWLDNYIWLDKVEQYWTEERTKEEAKKYETKKDFRNAVPSAYYAAHRHGWLKEYDWFVHPVMTQKWTYDACYEEAKKYNTISEFRKNSNSCYVSACTKGWIKDFTWLYEK